MVRVIFFDSLVGDGWSVRFVQESFCGH